MQLVENEKTAYYKFDQFSRYSNLVHFVTTRRGGVSGDSCHSLNIGFGTGDSYANVLANRHIMAEAMGIPLGSFVMLNQVHKSNVEIIYGHMKGNGAFDRESAVRATDAAITMEQGICLFVMAADCVPLLFYDPVKHAIGACHAGWRGTVQKIAVTTVQNMVRSFGCKAENIQVAVGPSIGPCCYTVGKDVIDSVTQSFGTTHNLIRYEGQNSQPYFDLWEANKIQLLDAGILEESIETARLCTSCNAEDFFSSRHDNGNTGRFGAGIMLV